MMDGHNSLQDFLLHCVFAGVHVCVNSCGGALQNMPVIPRSLVW